MHLKFLILSLGFLQVVVPCILAQKPNSNQKNTITDECSEEGFSCSDCGHSLYCFKLPNGDWSSVLFECDKGETCSSITGYCSPEINPYCYLDYKIPCDQIGVFPHPFQCTRYYFCNANENGTVIVESNMYTCQEGFAFDPSTLICSKKFEGSCDRIVKDCVNIGEIGPVIGNTHMYYSCWNTLIGEERIVLPHISYCPNGERFINNNCRRPTPPSGLNPNGQCNSTGEFYDAKDCKKFNICSNIGNVPATNSCEPNYYYDGWSKTCKPFQCP